MRYAFRNAKPRNFFEQNTGPGSNRSTSNRSTSKRNRLRLQLEQLESRQLLAGNLGSGWSWFESFDEVPRIAPSQLADVSAPLNGTGPFDLHASEWILQLSEDAIEAVPSLDAADQLLDRWQNDFTVIAGLGSPGSLLVRARGVTIGDVEDSLQQNAHVGSFSQNQLIEGQVTLPSDPEFVGGLLPGLDRINASDAWDEGIGSLNTVVGVVDSGFDPTHPDLYLNVWLNQGELPADFLDDDGNQLVDTDGDGLISFYDLNAATRAATSPFELTVAGFASGPNAEFVRDLNGNGRIDAIDLLEDANWADGRDTDQNGFSDDLFGVNFRTGADDPFAANNPSDELGHGTHVAGTIGAIGGNSSGVVGVNWQTSLMSLRILDNNNQGDSGAAIRAVNYARQMRERFRTDDTGRITAGANVRVLNNSYGQPGGFEASLEAAISDAGDAGILFVAAAGNGNILGQGVDNDRTPFYPASYDSPNVIAVTASDQSDQHASFSNFGSETVDIVAPGVGIRSTVPGGGYQSANGTSMATPHVAGTAALIWAALPEATVAEVRQAILSSVDVLPQLDQIVSTGGRLNAASAINADAFAPAARLVSKQDITTSGGASTEFTVEYSHRSGINSSTIGSDDLAVVRQWGPADAITATLKPGSVSQAGNALTATYVVAAPGGSWDPFDFGDYQISTVDGAVAANANQSVQSRVVGSFNVRVGDDPSVLYVDQFNDSLEPGSLRSAIISANAASPSPRTIILDHGRYTIDIPHQEDPASAFADPAGSLHCGADEHATGWSNETTGDFDVTGSITLVGDSNDETIIDANSIDRVFKVHSGAELDLSRMTITGGLSPADQGGGGILSVGDLSISDSIVRDNLAVGESANDPIRGGGIAVWGGTFDLSATWIAENESDFGGGVFVCDAATGSISRSTLSENRGGGLHSHSDGNIDVSNSTFSDNRGGRGAIFNGKRDDFTLRAGDSGFQQFPKLDASGSLVVFESFHSGFVPNDNNGKLDVFAFDVNSDSLERISVGINGEESNGNSRTTAVSSDGRFVAFVSAATNLVPNDTNGQDDIFLFDRLNRATQRINLSPNGSQASGSSSLPTVDGTGDVIAFTSFASNLSNEDGNGSDVFVYESSTGLVRLVSRGVSGNSNGSSTRPDVSDDGRFVVFESSASNLIAGDTNGVGDIFVFDVQSGGIERVSVGAGNLQADGSSQAPTISGDGRYVTYESAASNLVAGDTNSGNDVFLFDRQLGTTTRVSRSFNGSSESNGDFLFPKVSSDGRFVSFDSDAANLVANDTNGVRDAFLYDRISDSLVQLSVSPTGVAGNAETRFSSVSSDARFVALSSIASNLVDHDTNGVNDIFLIDRQAMLTTSLTAPRINSTIHVAQSTIAETRGSQFSVAGQVDLRDVLSTRQTLPIDQERVTSNNLITGVASGANLVGELTRLSQLPPIHPLLAGNPAIDAGDASFVGTVDQLGNQRDQPDVGAHEALKAAITGSVFVDLNANQTRESNEPGLSGIELAALARGETEPVSATSSADFALTLEFDETGSYRFNELVPGLYDFSIEPPNSFTLSQGSIERIPTSGGTNSATLSADGRYVAFLSSANDLVPNDTNDRGDVFRFDRL
ncbi:MAG: S8 family serine peptidase, partial [Rubripirellula sp.]